MEESQNLLPGSWSSIEVRSPFFHHPLPKNEETKPCPAPRELLIEGQLPGRRF
jgi:hypothetical protein